MAIVLGAVAATALVVRPWRLRPRPLAPSATAGYEHRSRSVRPPWLMVVLLAGAVALIDPFLAIVGSVLAAVLRHRRIRRQQVSSDAEIVHSFPDVVDLLLLGVGAGLTPRETLARCRRWLPEPFGVAIESALRRADSGAPFADSLDRSMLPLGDHVRPLVAALLAGERDGAALGSSLERVSDEARRRRRMLAQERARRVPVAMLAPLLLCVLPSFALLTVAPLVLGSLTDLGLGY